MIENELKTIQIRFKEMEEQLLHYRSLESIRPIGELADVLRTERKKQKLTLKDLSELSGISYSTLVKLESGDDAVNLKTLKQAARTLGVRLWVG